MDAYKYQPFCNPSAKPAAPLRFKLNRLVRHVLKYPLTSRSHRALFLSHYFTRIICSHPSSLALSSEPQRHRYHWSTSPPFQLIYHYFYLHTAGPFRSQRRPSTPRRRYFKYVPKDLNLN